MPHYMTDEELADWKAWEQTDEDRAAIREYWEELARVQAGERRARKIAATDTVCQRVRR